MTDKKQIIASIRVNLEFAGIDTSRLTDEEVEEAVLKFATAVGRSGVKAKEAAGALVKLSQMG